MLFASESKKGMEMEYVKMTKEELLRRWKQALEHKRAWEEDFKMRYSGVTNIYNAI